MPDAQTFTPTPDGRALFKYPEWDPVSKTLNYDVPGIVVTTLHPYAYNDLGPHWVVRCDDGAKMAVRTDQLFPAETTEA